MNTTIPTFGAINGTQGNPQQFTANPSLATVVAVMYNYYDPSLISNNSAGLVTNSSNRIVLNPYGINPADPTNICVNPPPASMDLNNFLSLFYPTNAGYFNVNPTNCNNPAIILSSQTFTSSNSTLDRFSLVQFLLRAYCTNKGINVNDLDPRIMVLLQKECFATQSLAGIKGTTISMSWDEVINSLIRSGVMDASGNSTGTNPNSAIVPLCVVLNYHSFVLDIDLSIRFTYLVNINGYLLPTPATQFSPAQPTWN